MGEAAEDGFTAFMAGRSHALLRTAYLLTGDHGLAIRSEYCERYADAYRD
jgi:hypothetical protein